MLKIPVRFIPDYLCLRSRPVWTQQGLENFCPGHMAFLVILLLKSSQEFRLGQVDSLIALNIVKRCCSKPLKYFWPEGWLRHIRVKSKLLNKVWNEIAFVT